MLALLGLRAIHTAYHENPSAAASAKLCPPSETSAKLCAHDPAANSHTTNPNVNPTAQPSFLPETPCECP